MPEATINEDGDALSRKDEIGTNSSAIEVEPSIDPKA